MYEKMETTTSYLIYTLKTVFTPNTAKIIFTGLFVVYGFFFDESHAKAHLALFSLIILDFISGVAAAKSTGTKIKSSKIRHTAIKITAYFSMVAGAYLAESGLHESIAILDEVVLSFLLVTEFVSLLENIGKLGFDTPKGLLNKLVEYKNKQ